VQYINLYAPNVNAPNVNAPNFIKHTLKDLKAHIDSNTVVVGDFNTLLSPIDRLSKWKINKEILGLNDTINQNIHPTTTQYTFFSAVHGIFSKIDDILGHKVSLSKLKKIEISPYILSDHNALKLELNTKTRAENIQIIRGWIIHCSMISGS
jgi:endonuclease/exonuclease/phosphatase family metal-dependent hydrolase